MLGMNLFSSKERFEEFRVSSLTFEFYWWIAWFRALSWESLLSTPASSMSELFILTDLEVDFIT